jgi:hypothetical protein
VQVCSVCALAGNSSSSSGSLPSPKGHSCLPAYQKQAPGLADQGGSEGHIPAGHFGRVWAFAATTAAATAPGAGPMAVMALLLLLSIVWFGHSVGSPTHVFVTYRHMLCAGWSIKHAGCVMLAALLVQPCTVAGTGRPSTSQQS